MQLFHLCIVTGTVPPISSYPTATTPAAHQCCCPTVHCGFPPHTAPPQLCGYPTPLQMSTTALCSLGWLQVSHSSRPGHWDLSIGWIGLTWRGTAWHCMAWCDCMAQHGGMPDTEAMDLVGVVVCEGSTERMDG